MKTFLISDQLGIPKGLADRIQLSVIETCRTSPTAVAAMDDIAEVACEFGPKTAFYAGVLFGRIAEYNESRNGGFEHWCFDNTESDSE